MKVMVCEYTPYLMALEGLRKVLWEILLRGCPFEQLDEYRKTIDIPGLEPVYDEYSLEHKLRYMNSSRRFIRHVRKFARLAGVKMQKRGWNLFLLPEVQGNKILVGKGCDAGWIVVAFQGPAEVRFIGMMRSRHPEFQDVEQIVVESLWDGDPYAAQERADLDTIKRLLTA